MNFKNLSLEEFASFICTKLKESDVDVVLSGGSCMELYTNSNYSSYDIDLIMKRENEHKKVEKVMLSLGFEKEHRYFKHKDNPNYIEFPTGPVSLGEEFPKKFIERKTHIGTLVLLSATDCIKDRLCALVYHGGEECFNHALAVAHLNSIDFEDLKQWAKNEDKQMISYINKLIDILQIIKKDEVNHQDIKAYLEQKAKEVYLDIDKVEDFEQLKEDLYDDYVLKVFFGNDIFYKMDEFYKICKRLDDKEKPIDTNFDEL